MIIDAHQHFWNYNSQRHSWIKDDMATIRGDFLPKDLEVIYKRNDIDGCVAVQVEQDESENEYLLAFARQHSFIKGIVGWIDLQHENIEDRLAHYSTEKKLKGFRHIVQGESDPNFLLRNNFCRGIKLLERHNFTYDILVYHHQLAQVEPFVKKFPNQKFIIDHIAKPAIANKEMASWATYMRAIAKHENVYCKLSGMVTEANFSNWTYNDLEPYISVVLKCFGPSRLVYGSDWPVCLMAASYEEQFDVIKRSVDKLLADEKSMVLGGNAVGFYRL